MTALQIGTVFDNASGITSGKSVSQFVVFEATRGVNLGKLMRTRVQFHLHFPRRVESTITQLAKV